jgi:hypothetical protein
MAENCEIPVQDVNNQIKKNKYYELYDPKENEEFEEFLKKRS